MNGRLRFVAGTCLVLMLEACLTFCAEPEEGIGVSKDEQTIRSDISADEEVVFYPTSGRFDEQNKTWTIPIHGIIYEPEYDSRKRNALLATIRKVLQVGEGDLKSQFLDQRLRLFLVDNERGQEISVRIGQRVFEAGTSLPNGHFRNTLSLDAEDVEPLIERETGADWLTYEAVTRSTDRRKFSGRVRLIGPAGLSVISDIDDTIKVSNVRNRKVLFTNTFLREFRPVVGMAPLYRQGAELDMAFHYVSGSPWQLYLPLAEFMESEGFPKGTFHLKHFRLKDRTRAALLQSQESYKLAAIEPILEAYPKRRFILIGDSGEQDPEIYAKVAKKYAGQVVAVLIRNVTEEATDNPRFLAVQEQLGKIRFELFEEPDSLRPIIAVIAKEND
jgi:hypothetical protein